MPCGVSTQSKTTGVTESGAGAFSGTPSEISNFVIWDVHASESPGLTGFSGLLEWVIFSNV